MQDIRLRKGGRLSAHLLLLGHGLLQAPDLSLQRLCVSLQLHLVAGVAPQGLLQFPPQCLLHPHHPVIN